MTPGIDPSIREPLAYMHGHLEGFLSFEGNVVPMKVVVEPEGRLVAPAMVAMLRAPDTVLYLPDEEDSSLHLMVSLVEFDEDGPDGALADRWRIYHGEPEDLNWALLHIEAGRLDGVFYDGDGLLVPNSLHAVEAEICRWANSTMVESLKRACLNQAQRELNNPRLVGVDPLGFDVRGRFEIVRLQVDSQLESAEDAKAQLTQIAESQDNPS